MSAILGSATDESGELGMLAVADGGAGAGSDRDGRTSPSTSMGFIGTGVR
ncbi:MAG: hypothetical protein JOZ09_00295 [Pseudonocardiales bacterium]|nr:hypothetical protein [Pseudonocardiales bacterium]